MYTWMLCWDPAEVLLKMIVILDILAYFAGRQPTLAIDKLLSVDQSEQSQGWAGPQPVRTVECYDPAANRRAKRGVISTGVYLRPDWFWLYILDL